MLGRITASVFQHARRLRATTAATPSLSLTNLLRRLYNVEEDKPAWTQRTRQGSIDIVPQRARPLPIKPATPINAPANPRRLYDVEDDKPAWTPRTRQGSFDNIHQRCCLSGTLVPAV